MWSYYGSKSKIVDYYPTPKYQKIIEPFAGSAKYALKYFEKDVLLVDKYEPIIKLWKWLQLCSPNDIKKLPVLKQGDDIRNIAGLCEEERILLGYGAQAGVAIFGNTVTEAGTRNMVTMFKNVANNLHKIKHWEIRLGSYDEIENEEATWFIDPPYQFGGHKYKHSNKKIDFKQLAEWCRSRNGQTIVCENMKADWLEFKALKKIQGLAQTGTIEAIWSNHKTNYDNVQVSLFEGM